MHYRRETHTLALFVLAALCIAPPAFAQQLPPHPTTDTQQIPAPSTATLIPVYPDSSAGLEKLMKDMLELDKHGDANTLAPYLQSLILPDSDVWFKATFGNKWGAKLDGAFRYIGNLPGKMNQLARSADAQQKVVLTGTIGEDGVLRRLARSSGPCWLEDLAIKVIQQWHYAPTVLLGKPVEVHTTITVIFSPGG